MKNLRLLVVAIVLVTMVLASLVAMGQGPSRPSFTPATEATFSEDDVYTVQPGDSLWKLSQDKWPELERMNPFLKGRRTTRANGWIYVMIHPGEQLHGVKSLGLQIVNAVPTPSPSPSPSPTITFTFECLPGSPA